MFLVKLYNDFGRAKWVPARVKNGRLALVYAGYHYWPEWKAEVAINIHLLKVNKGFRGWKFRRSRK